MSRDSAAGTYKTDELRELLTLWQRPGGVLTPRELRALLAWTGTPTEERFELEARLNATQQVADATPLAANQRRGHNNLIDRLRSFLTRRL